MSPSPVVLLAPIVPFLGALLIWVFRDHPNPREAVTLLTAVALFGLVASLFPEVSGGLRPSALLAEPIPGLKLAFVVEPLV